MKLSLLIPLVVILIGSFGSSNVQALEVGSQLQGVSALRGLDQLPLPELEKGRGQIRVLAFFNTWSIPCREELPRLNRLAVRLKGQGDVVIVSREPMADLRRFVRQATLIPTVARDQEEKLYQEVLSGVRGVPFALLLDDQQRILWFGHPEYGLVYAALRASEKKLDWAQARAMTQWVQGLEKAESAQQLKSVLKNWAGQDGTNPAPYRLALAQGHIWGPGERRAWVQRWARQGANDSYSLQELVRTLLQERRLLSENPMLLLKCARDAVQLSDKKDDNALLFLIQVLLRFGLFNEAERWIAEIDTTSANMWTSEEIVECRRYLAAVQALHEAESVRSK